VKRPTRVLVADNHPAFLTSLSRALSACDALEIVAFARDGKEAVRLAREHRPDVAIVDVRMDELDGMAAITLIRGAAPDAVVIMLSLSHDRQYVRRALASGAAGYVSKSDVGEEIVDAVETTLAGRHFFSSSVLRELRASSVRLFSVETWHALQDTIDQEGSSLLRFARVISGDEERASRVLWHSLAAYAMARDFSEEIRNARVWLLVATACELFPAGPPADEAGGREQTANGPRRAANLRTWISGLHGQCSAHADFGTFAAYWRHDLSARERAALGEHLHCCQSCHLQWCLVGYRTLMSDDNSPPNGSPDPALLGVRKQLLNDIHGARVDRFLTALSRHDANLRKLVASDVEVLLGEAAAVGDPAEISPRTGAPAQWTAEFLGRKMSPFLATGFHNQK